MSAPIPVHVWFASAENFSAASLNAISKGLVPSAERSEIASYQHDGARHLALLGRTMIRWALSRVQPKTDPRDWDITTNDHGRPQLRDGSLRFNMSHTQHRQHSHDGLVVGRVCVAVTEGRDVGIDVEPLDKEVAIESLAQNKFAPSEADALLALPREQHTERFFRYWTLKESYIKARGLGLAIALDKFAFDLSTGIHLRVDPALADDARTWVFHQNLLNGYVWALACRTGGEGLALTVDTFTP